jgi:hypothetical protein
MDQMVPFSSRLVWVPIIGKIQLAVYILNILRVEIEWIQIHKVYNHIPYLSSHAMLLKWTALNLESSDINQNATQRFL